MAKSRAQEIAKSIADRFQLEAKKSIKIDYLFAKLSHQFSQYSIHCRRLTNVIGVQLQTVALITGSGCSGCSTSICCTGSATGSE